MPKITKKWQKHEKNRKKVEKWPIWTKSGRAIWKSHFFGLFGVSPKNVTFWPLFDQKVVQFANHQYHIHRPESYPENDPKSDSIYRPTLGPPFWPTFETHPSSRYSRGVSRNWLIHTAFWPLSIYNQASKVLNYGVGQNPEYPKWSVLTKPKKAENHCFYGFLEVSKMRFGIKPSFCA